MGCSAQPQPHPQDDNGSSRTGCTKGSARALPNSLWYRCCLHLQPQDTGCTWDSTWTGPGRNHASPFKFERGRLPSQSGSTQGLPFPRQTHSAKDTPQKHTTGNLTSLPNSSAAACGQNYVKPSASDSLLWGLGQGRPRASRPFHSSSNSAASCSIVQAQLPGNPSQSEHSCRRQDHGKAQACTPLCVLPLYSTEAWLISKVPSSSVALHRTMQACSLIGEQRTMPVRGRQGGEFQPTPAQFSPDVDHVRLTVQVVSGHSRHSQGNASRRAAAHPCASTLKMNQGQADFQVIEQHGCHAQDQVKGQHACGSLGTHGGCCPPTPGEQANDVCRTGETESECKSHDPDEMALLSCNRSTHFLKESLKVSVAPLARLADSPAAHRNPYELPWPRLAAAIAL